MKACRVLLLTSLPLMAAPLFAASLEQVLDAYYQARGGLAKLRALESFQSEGAVSTTATTVPFKLYVKKHQSRLDLHAGGLVVVQVFDGRNGWQINPTYGTLSPQPLSRDELHLLMAFTDLSGPLVDWQEKGYTLRYLGVEDINDRLVHSIFVQTDLTAPRIYHLDANTYLPVSFFENTADGMALHLVQQRKVVDGITFVTMIGLAGAGCKHASHQAGDPCQFSRTMTFDAPVVNPQINDALFVEEDVVARLADSP